MKAVKIISALLAVFIGLPIAFYLQYQILKRIDASELMWFLFWVNVPVVIFAQLVAKLAEKSSD